MKTEVWNEDIKKIHALSDACSRYELLTCRSCNVVSSGIAADVREEDSDAVNIPEMAIPIVIQNIAKILP